MSKFSVSLREKECQEKVKKEMAKIGRESLGKYFFDLSKLTFTALILGGSVSLFTDYKVIASCSVMIFVGLIGTWAFARIGIKTINK